MIDLIFQTTRRRDGDSLCEISIDQTYDSIAYSWIILESNEMENLLQEKRRKKFRISRTISHFSLDLLWTIVQIIIIPEIIVSGASALT